MNESSTAIGGPAPLLIGVTGHKDLFEDEKDLLRASVRAALEDFLRAMNVSPGEARILTGLAEGADALVAEVALELGIPLVPVLPMPMEVYCEEFSDPAALEAVVKKVIEASPSEVAGYKAGKTKLLGFFVGQVMKETKGQANPGLVNDLVKKHLDG